ncbi:MAG: inorganic diphosphatase [Myxococcota bacterium]
MKPVRAVALALTCLALGAALGRWAVRSEATPSDPARTDANREAARTDAAQSDAVLNEAARRGAMLNDTAPSNAEARSAVALPSDGAASPSPWPIAFIENPAGAVAKYEVHKESGELRQDVRNGAPRVIDFLGYPANYGFIEGTRAGREGGGDGDPLDVLVLGPPLERGARVPVRVLGMLRLLDAGERDDKLVARVQPVASGEPFADVNTFRELEGRYPAALRIIERWFLHYDRQDPAESQGFADEEAASAAIAAARP